MNSSGGEGGGGGEGTGATGGGTSGRGGGPGGGQGGGAGSTMSGGDGGTPSGMGGAPASPMLGRVLFSEIMYNPVLENDAVDNHEFIELKNTTNAAVVIGNWRLDGEVKFTFPAGASVPANGFVVIAKNKARLVRDVPSYGLTEAQVLGDYMGALDNGGGTIALLDAAGGQVDALRYNDGFPWATGADGFGASEQFFPMNDPLGRVPFMKHQFQGFSLERVSYTIAGTEVANWVPSKLDGATPGKPNSTTGNPPPIVMMFSVVPPDPAAMAVRPMEVAKIKVTFSMWGTPTAPQLEWFAEFRDSRDQADKTPQKVAFAKAGEAWEAPVPGQPQNTIVRFRITGDGGAVLSPRPTDPYPFHAYFVGNDLPGKMKAVQIFITPQNWAQLYTNISPSTGAGRVFSADACRMNPTWDNRVNAVFVADNIVYNVRARYQGSPYNRWNGATWIAGRTFTGVGPANGTGGGKALSWSLVFPRYQRYGGRGHIHFNKLTQACPGGLATMIMSRVYHEAKLPSLKVFGFNRLYINGGYYHTVMDREHVDDVMIKRVYGAQAEIGDLWKNVGFHREQGPWGVGDASVIGPLCNLTPKQRFDYTYERVTNDFRVGADDVRVLITDLNAARDADKAAADAAWTRTRKFLMDKFDIDQLLSYKALLNWGDPWDDYWQNHFYYKRPDGKWVIFPYDFDGLVGGMGGATDSPYDGEQGDPSARVCCDTVVMKPWWNVLVDSLFKAFRKEYNARVMELLGTVLSPANVAKYVDEIVGAQLYNQDEARASPGGTGCPTDYMQAAAGFKSFATSRAPGMASKLRN